MCGIWASINAPDAVAGLQAAAHRGPDGEGWARFDTPAGRLELGHRRLAIYDPTPASDQPASCAEGRYTLVFNGALYNYRELREELKALGHVFRTTGDTEVFLAAFAEWGCDCFARIDGMFAAVFYDAKRQVLTIARDRFGEKPLFMDAQDGQYFCVASEARQFSAASKRKPQIDRFSLEDYLSAGRVDHRGGLSFFDYESLRPGTWREIDLSSKRIPGIDSESDSERALFWDPDVPWEMSEPDVISALRDAMDLAVSRQLVADVPVGGCLSGGLDSTIILATVDRLRSRQSDPFVCVSAIFDETDDGGQSLSERPYVEAAIKGKNIELVEVHPDETDVADRLDDILKKQGEPFPGTSICAQYFVFEAARKAGIKVMLDGQGADELFAGYAPMAGYAMADRLARLDLSSLNEFNALIAEPSDLTAASLSRGTWRALVSESFRRRVLSALGKFPPRGGPVTLSLPPPPFRQFPEMSRLEMLINRLVLRDSLPGLLRYEDRNSMAFAVETRLPFLSQAVGDLALRIPSNLKVKSGYTKYILRKAFEDRLPPEIAWRRKKLGFVTPQQRWMRGKVGRWVDQHLENSIEAFRPILNADWIETELARKASGQAPGETAFRVACAGRWAELTGARL
jgi:asparagine synthase (glutamine-hydrolysing)